MSAPLSASAYVKALRDAGVKVVTVGDWERHNRNSVGAWGPVNGVMIHHTVTRGTASTVEIIRRGYAGLPGPLAHGMIAKDGTVYVVGYGRCNHAGKGDRDVLNAVIAESYATVPPAPNGQDVDGNPRFYGFECENAGDGKDPWPAAQLAAIDKVAAAICKAHGWTAKSVIGHAEWTATKVDPKGIKGGMPGIRSRVAAILAPKKPPAPKPPAPKPKTVEQRLAALESRVAVLEKR